MGGLVDEVRTHYSLHKLETENVQIILSLAFLN